MALIKKKETSGNFDIGSALGNLASDVSKKANTVKQNIRTGIQTGIQNATNDFENFADQYADDIPGFTLLGSAVKSNRNTRKYVGYENEANAKLKELEGTRPVNPDENPSEKLLKAQADYDEIMTHQDDAINKYDDRIQSALDQIDKYSEFNYDVESDPLWNSIRSQYQRNAMLGMRDTLGAASNLTGGYASSYALSAAQQAYQNNIAQMTDIIPSLQDSALDRFKANQQGAINNFYALEDAYQNELAEWQNNRDHYYNKLMEMSDDEWAHYMDNLSAWMADRSYWTDQRNTAINNQQWQMQLDEQKAEFREQLAYEFINMGVDAGTRIATAAIPAAASLAGTGINAGVDLVGLGLDKYKFDKNLAEDQRQFDAIHGLGDYATTPTSTSYTGGAGGGGKKSNNSNSGSNASLGNSSGYGNNANTSRRVGAIKNAYVNGQISAAEYQQLMTEADDEYKLRHSKAQYG